jgi:TP901 family phage tail tape measure protein
MAKPYEQDVVLDADGKPLFSAMDIFQRRVDAIQKTITNIQKDSYKTVADLNKTLDANVKSLRDAMNGLRAVSTPKATRDRDYTAALKAEANAVKDTDRVVKGALREQAELRKKGYDEARAFTLKEAKDRQAASRETTQRIAADEREGARIVAENNRRRVQQEIETQKLIRASRISAARDEAVANAKSIQDSNALTRARVDNMNKMQIFRQAQKTETNPEQLRALAQLIAMEKARGQALEQNMRTFEAANRRMSGLDNKTQKALAPAAAQRDVQIYGISNARSRAVDAQTLATQNLLNAASERERVTALQSLDLARAKLAAIERMVAKENQLAAAAERVKKADERAAAGDANLSGRSQKMLANRYATDAIASLGPQQALNAALGRQLIAQNALKGAVGQQQVAAQRLLGIEDARVAAIERQIAAASRRAAQDAREAARGAPGPEKENPLKRILSPGYAVSAIARTGVYGAAAGAAYGAFNAAQSGLSNTIEIEDEMVKLQAIANATDTQMQTLRGSIFAIGETSRFATTDLIKISQTLAQAGVAAGDMQKVLASVTTLATASGSTPEEAVQLVTSALGSFQLSASESSRVADLMTEALNRTKLTVQQVGQAIQYVGATAYEQNISLEQLLATVGSVAQAGIKSGSTIGTGFRQFLVDLQDPSKKLTEQLTLLKLTSADIDVSVRGLPAVLDTLRNAGFGASQAYAGLETRAAAFYLTAKNNVDVADQLQLSFSYSTAALVANERAMNSVTAQWQRFKNIVGQQFTEDMQGVVSQMENTLRWISDKLVQSEKLLDERQGRRDKGQEKFYEMDITGGYSNTEGLAGGLNSLISLVSTNDSVAQWFVDIQKSSDGASAASERLGTQINETSGKIDEHKQRVTELDKELIRLITQKDTLRNNDTRSAAETATLTSRFVGLANQLTVTGNRYDDLVQAARRYRLEQLRLMGVELQVQQLQLGQQSRESRSNLRTNLYQINNNAEVMAALNPQERGAVKGLYNSEVGSQAFTANLGILSAAVERLGKTNQSVANVLSRGLNPAGTYAQSTAQLGAIAPALGAARAGQTGAGAQLNTGYTNISAIIEQLGSQTNGSPEKRRLTGQGNAILNEMDTLINRRLAQNPNAGENRTYLLGMQQEVTSFRTQLRALNSATAEEVATGKKLARERTQQERRAGAEARRADSEAAKGPAITQAQFDEVLARVTGMPLGSGQRTAAEQNDLHRRGKTRATADTSSHSKPGGIARDVRTGAISDARGEQLEEAVRAEFKRAYGIDVYVKYENGRGKNNGTAPHLHGNTLPGQNRIKPGSESRGASEQFQYDTAMDQAQLELDRKGLAESLKQMATATTSETFDAAAASAQKALERVNQNLKDIAGNELASAGIANTSDPRWQAKMAQVDQAIAQNIEAYQRQITDGLLKSFKATVKRVQESFEASLKPSQNTLAIAQASASGLNNYTMRNRVPEQTRILADARVAQAQEGAQRAELQQLPGRIAGEEAALADLKSRAEKTSGLDLDRINAQIEETNNNLANLRTTREALAASLGVEGLLPQTLSQGVSQAIAAYKEMNNMNQTFTQTLNGEMLGGITTIGDAFQNMFSGIISGSQSVLGAIGGFAKAIMSAITQIVTKIIATKIISLMFSIFGGSLGGDPFSASNAGPVNIDSSSVASLVPSFAGYHGGQVPGFAGGGQVMGGHDMRDSTLAKLSKKEFVVRRAAVESVGTDFMHKLNKRGAAALDSTKDTPPIAVAAQQSVNVWMVKPDEKPSMGPQDVLVTWQNDVLSNGESRRLIQHVARDSR